jgi:TolB-like protein/tetratricopeptide (TPR) repeat protein
MADDAVSAFGRFEVHRSQRRLLAAGEPVELGDRAFDLLLALMDARGALVTKAALMEAVWPGQTVEENNIAVQVSALRRALGGDRVLIQTVPRRGYRFLGRLDAAVAAPGPASPAPRLSIIVLPFGNLRGDAALDYLVDGITESLTTDILRALPGSFVVSRGTAFSFRDRTTDLRRIGRELGVGYVLDGSVLVDTGRVRVNARLIDTVSGSQLWADRFDKQRSDVLGVQDEIVARLSRSVGLEIIDAEARHSTRSRSSEALDFVMRGWAAMNRPTNRDSLIEARGLFEQALRVDPANSDALAQLGTIMVFEVLNGYYDSGRDERLAGAEAILVEALARDPNHIAALRARVALLRARGAFREAIVAADVVIAGNPGEPRIHNETGLSRLYLGEIERAIECFGQAARIGPRDPSRWVWLSGLGRAQIFLGQEAEAVQSLQAAVAANPRDFFARAFLAAACALVGHRAEAEAALQECDRLRPGLTLGALSALWSVPIEATAPRYREGHARLLAGLARAGMPP